MKQHPILRALGRKGANKAALAEKPSTNPSLLPAVIAVLHSDRFSIRFGCGDVLEKASAVNPGLLARHRDLSVCLLTGESRILRWDATRIVGTLAAANPGEWFENLFDRYFAPIAGHELIAAANVIAGAGFVRRGASCHGPDRVSLPAAQGAQQGWFPKVERDG